MKFVLAERDIRSSLAEQEFLVKRFRNTVEQIKESEGKKGAYAANQLLKEGASTFLLDAKLLTVASRASILSSEAWLRHDLEHNPTYVASRFDALTGTMDEIHNNVSPLEVLEELQTHAADCLNEMNWLSRNIFNRGLKKDIKERQIPAEKTENNSTLETKAPSMVLWKDNNNHTRSVILDVEVESDKQPAP